jgi:hypothetical protein
MKQITPKVTTIGVGDEHKVPGEGCLIRHEKGESEEHE